MENNFSILEGKVKILDKEYNAELINDSLAIKSNFNPKELNTIINSIVEFIPLTKSVLTYYLYIDKKNINYYSYISYHVLLLYRHYMDSKEMCFEIISKGFTNAVNISTRNLKDPFYNIKHNLDKDFFKTDVSICDKEYKASFINHGLMVSNNLCSADFSTGLKLIPKDGQFINKIMDIYRFAIKFLQFVTLNTYSKIDNFIIYNEHGGYSEIEINDDVSDYDTSNDKFLYLACLGENINKVINVFPNAITRQHNLYHYKRGWVFEFDIVRLSGTFEGVFRENIEHNTNYKKAIDKKKKSIHYDELTNLLNDFRKKNKIKNNDDYNACMMMFNNYAGTLKYKLEYVLTDFCRTMNMKIVDIGFFYSPKEFEKRIKDSRNTICHGLNNKNTNWKKIVNDTLLLQELIYFMLLKYKLNLKNGKIRSILNESFESLNIELSLMKKD